MKWEDEMGRRNGMKLDRMGARIGLNGSLRLLPCRMHPAIISTAYEMVLYYEYMGNAMRLLFDSFSTFKTHQL